LDGNSNARLEGEGDDGATTDAGPEAALDPEAMTLEAVEAVEESGDAGGVGVSSW